MKKTLILLFGLNLILFMQGCMSIQRCLLRSYLRRERSRKRAIRHPFGRNYLAGANSLEDEKGHINRWGFALSVM